jgi:hypothetical protein
MKLCFVSVNGRREIYLLDEPRTSGFRFASLPSLKWMFPNSTCEKKKEVHLPVIPLSWLNTVNVQRIETCMSLQPS